MKETTIALENASPGLAEWVARARREHTTFVVLDAAVPVARLVPTSASRCTGAELARALATTTLSPDEARAWADDLRQSRAALSAPEDKWR
jgi:antitoxin (DNA-binding transcriptional repressor) of toxin-antitoxin stability system